MYIWLGLIAFFVKSPGGVPPAPVSHARGVLTDTAIIRRTPTNQLANRPAIRITGTVTYANPYLRDFFIQDDYTGLYVMPFEPWPNVKRGDRVTVTGRAVAGDFAPCIEATNVTIVGSSELPGALPYDLGQADSRWLDAQQVAVVADVVSVTAHDDHCEMKLNTARTQGTVIIPGAHHAATLSAYRGKTVKVTGVCVPHFNDRRTIVGPPRIFVSSPSQVEVIPMKARFAAPQDLAIADLKHFLPTPFPGSRRVRIHGIVVGIWEGQVFVQDGSHGVTLLPKDGIDKVTVGQRIVSCGLLNVFNEVSQLHEATIANDQGKKAKLPDARSVSDEDLVRGTCHAQRVRVIGTLVAIEPTRFGTPAMVIELENARAIVLDPSGAPHPAIGSSVEATGLAIKKGPWASADCGLWLGDSSPVVVLHGPPEPPFWNGAKVGSILIAFGAISCSAIVWLVILRRTLARQKNLLRLKAQRELELAEKLRQSQKMEAIGRLAGGIAHDFNNMLTVINGSAEILPEIVEVDPDGASALAADIRMAGTKAAGLVAQLLTFSRQRPTQLAPVDLNEVVTDCEKMLRRVIGEDVKIFTIKGEELPPVMGEPILLHQVIVNLVVNARDAMPKGGIVTIATRKITDNDGTPIIRLSVADSGCGMTKEVREKVFEPFFTTKGVGQGTGLGLATVYGIVQTLGGSIRIDSEPGIGTTFDIDFPIAPPAKPASSTETKSISRILRSNASHRILLVEDDDAVRELTTRILERVGLTVATADTSELALEMLASVRYDLLITDVVMPGMGGRELADRAREADPGLRILFISGYTADEVLRRGVQEDDVDFLNKPFATNQMSEKVREILARKPGKRSSRMLPTPCLSA